MYAEPSQNHAFPVLLGVLVIGWGSAGHRCNGGLDALPERAAFDGVREVVFLDRGAENWPVLAADAAGRGTEAGGREVVLLDPNRDGVAQITEALRSRRELDAIHLVSHARAGRAVIGRSVLDCAALADRSDEVRTWGTALSEQGDILLYGCELAATPTGRMLVDAAARLTRADVAASTDPTGHERLGGDWELEYRSGTVESAVVFSEPLRARERMLLPVYVEQTSYTQDLEIKSTDNGGQSFKYTSGSGAYSVNRIRLAIKRMSDATAQVLTMTLRSSWTGSVLASDTVDSSSVGTGYSLNSFDFEPVVLNDNQTYVIRVASSSPDGKVFLGRSADVYPGGSLLNKDGIAQGSADLLFQVALRDLIVVNTNNSGAGSLREAILNANAFPGADTIQFNIPGGGPHTILVTGSDLHSIWEPTTLDAATQPGYAGSPLVRLVAGDARQYGIRLWEGSDGSTVRGFAVTGFTGSGIDITSSGNVIAGNVLGVDAAGTGLAPNVVGINLWSAGGNLIGGTNAWDRNVVSGNQDVGILITGDSVSNRVVGNYIGTDVSGTAPLGNRSYGIALFAGARDNRIGGTGPGEGNRIQHNGLVGVAVVSGQANSILGNAISAHPGLGIDLNDDHVTANDRGDLDGGANAGQNFPVLAAVVTDGGSSVSVNGTLDSTADTPFRIEFFASAHADPSGYSEGETYLGFVNVATDAAGNADFAVDLNANVPAGAWITATATDSSGNTSEFCAPVIAPATDDLDPAHELWISTDSDVGAPGADGLPDGWREGEILAFGGPDLRFGPRTDGDLRRVVDLDRFTADPTDPGALHVVGRELSVGTGTHTFDLQIGDLLVSFHQDETILGAHFETGFDTVVHDQDLVVFRPAAPGDYTAGMFHLLLDDVVPIDLRAITLVEEDTEVGGTLLPAGTFLLTQETEPQEDVLHFVPAGVGPGTTSGSFSTLIDGSDIGIDASVIRAVDLIERPTLAGGMPLPGGALLISLRDDEPSVGGNALAAARHDIVVLHVTSAGSHTTAAAAMFLDGSDVHLDNDPGTETPYAVTLIPSLPPVVDLDGDDRREPGRDVHAVYTPGAGPTAIVDADADLWDLDGTTLASLVVSLSNRRDGASEVLGADTTGTGIESAYDTAAGTLTLSGDDSIANYRQVLRTVTYENLAAVPDPADRFAVFVAHDGRNPSKPAWCRVSFMQTYDLLPLAGPHGSIHPASLVRVAEGSSTQFVVTAAAHYHIADVRTNGVSVGSFSQADTVFTQRFDHVAADRTMEAEFAIDRFELTVASDYGAPTPAVGTAAYDYNTLIDASAPDSPVVNGTTRRLAAGWTGTGDAGSGSTTNTSFHLTRDSTLTWTWQTQFRLDTATAGNGSVDVADAWVDAGDSVTITASPAEGHHFVGWSGDAGGGDRVLVLAMNAAKSVTAHFAVDTGSLQVTIGPPAAVAGQARWRLTSGPDRGWHSSGDRIDALPIGAYAVQFADVDAFERPDDAAVVVTTGPSAHHQDYALPSTVFIPGGTYRMGNEAGVGGNATTVDAFLLKPGEVTIGEFQRFLDDTGGVLPAQPVLDADLPVVNVSWADAVSFLNWCSDQAGLTPAYRWVDGGWSLDRDAAGYRLPTEAEWEYASRGGMSGVLFPCGNAVDDTLANYEYRIGRPLRNGAYPANGYGLFDMAGNVREWTHDWFSPLLSDGVSNPTGPDAGTQRVTRGGSWASFFVEELTCHWRYVPAGPESTFSDLGFRWAMSVTDDDTDGDGMPNWWEQLHLRHPTDPDPSDDADEDGAGNLNEFRAGTDPRDAASLLRILDVFPAAGGVAVVWPSVSGKSYALEVIEEFDGTWMPAATEIPAEPPHNTFLDDTDPPPRCIYRVRVE